MANKEAEYYTRQIKEKEEILKNLERHHEEHSSRRKSFGRKWALQVGSANYDGY